MFFDAECGLCNRCVRLLLRLDRRAHLRFAPLQGPTAQAFLRAHGLPTGDFDSMVWVPEWTRRAEGGYLLRTDAVLAAFRAMGWFGRLAGVLRVLPTGVRDAVYRGVARCRYAVFGRWTQAPLSREEWAGRFLP